MKLAVQLVVSKTPIIIKTTFVLFKQIHSENVLRVQQRVPSILLMAFAITCEIGTLLCFV